MDESEAIILASQWVWTHYPVVPPVNLGLMFSERAIARLGLHGSAEITNHDYQKLCGKWFVSFFCSWDTDALGLPETLNVLVDSMSGEVETA